MERMNLLTSLSVAISLSFLPMPCYSGNNSDFFESLPENTILSIDKSYPDFKRVILDLPSGKSDTIWMASKSETYINKNDYNQQIISTNTISIPEIDFKSPAYTTKTVVNGKEVIINDAKYPDDNPLDDESKAVVLMTISTGTKEQILVVGITGIVILSGIAIIIKKIKK